MNKREQVRQEFEALGQATKGQCQEIARKVGMKTINCFFGHRRRRC